MMRSWRQQWEQDSSTRADGFDVCSLTPRSLRLLPPLIVGEAEIDDALARLARALDG